MIGLLSAMREEALLVEKRLQIKHSIVCADVNFHVGTLNDVEVVFGCCGVGKVNAAMATQVMLDNFNISKVIFTGLAGSLVPHLKAGDVVVSNMVVQHDFDLTAFGRRPGQVSDSERLIEADPKLVKIAAEVYEQTVAPLMKGGQVLVGTIVTGDSFIANEKRIKWLQREFGAIAAEMEGAAVGHVCYANRIPFVIIRIISDNASDGAANEFITFLEDASELTYRIISSMLPIIEPTNRTVNA